MAIEVEALSDGSVSEQTDATASDRMFIERAGSAAWISFSNLFGTIQTDLALGTMAAESAASYSTTAQADAAYLAIGGTAANSNQLGGVSASGYFRLSDNETVTGNITFDGSATFGSVWADGVGETAPDYANVNDKDSGFYWVSSGIMGVSSNSTKCAEFYPQGTTANTTRTVITREKGDARYATASSPNLKENIQALRADDNSLSQFWSVSGINFRYGGDLPMGDPRRGRDTCGFDLDELAAKFPQAVKFGEFVDDTPILAVHHEEIKFIRDRARAGFDRIDDQLQTARTVILNQRDQIQTLQQDLQTARQSFLALRDRVTALENA